MYSQLSWSTLPLAQTNLLPGLRSIWFRGQAQVESKMHSMRPIPAEDGQFGDPIQKHQVKFHYQLVMEFSMILCTVVSDIYIYIRYRYRVYIYITYIPNQENMANQHPINKMTPWHRHFQMPPLLAIDQVQMSLQWLSLVSLAYRLHPAHPNQLLSLPAMPPQRLFFSGCVQQQNTQIFCRISDASLVSWRQLLQLSSKAQSLDTKLNDFQWFSIWLHLQPLPQSLGLAHAAKNSFDFSHAIGGGFGRCHRHGCKMVCKRALPNTWDSGSFFLHSTEVCSGMQGTIYILVGTLQIVTGQL